MKLVHYTDKDHPLKEIIYREQSKDWFKPTGLWVSDDDDWGWRDWCGAEGYNLYGLGLSYDITLVDEHNILILNTVEEIRMFSHEFTIEEHIRWHVDWPRVQKGCDGLIITPYHPSIWIDLDIMWYNTWDCAGGCIWNPKAIERFDTCQTSS